MKLMCVCDHVYTLHEAGGPRCPSCGSSRVQRTVHVDAPRFVGCASGPFVKTVALEPIAVDLTMKESQHG